MHKKEKPPHSRQNQLHSLDCLFYIIIIIIIIIIVAKYVFKLTAFHTDGAK